MADVCDMADELIAQQLEQSLAAVPKLMGVSATHCKECDEPIPEERRVALPGVRLCVDCRSVAEVRRG